MVLNTQTLQVDGRTDGMGWDGSLGLVEYRAPYGANKAIKDGGSTAGLPPNNKQKDHQ